MEGNVRIRQDNREVAGKGDEKVFEAEQAYYDVRTERMMALKARVYTSTPGLLAPLRTDGDVINQYREIRRLRRQGQARSSASSSGSTDPSRPAAGSPIPGYRFDSQSLEIEDITVPLDRPDHGRQGGQTGERRKDQDKLIQFRAFNNFYYLGPVPVFYPPFTKFDSDFDPLLRNFRFQTGNVFGQAIQFDLSGFRLLNIRKPTYVDNWNIDVDYLSYRGLGVGTELSWFGRDLFGEIIDPYNKKKLGRDVDQQYFGYLDAWGIKDKGRDVLGPGPAIVTNGPPGAGKAGYQRTSVPSFQDYRGRATFRHMQRLLGDDAPDDEDFRFQLEASYISDRNFLEEYYKRLFDTGLDQETLALRHLPEAEPRPHPPGRGQPPELVHRHPVAPEAGIHPARRLGAGRLGERLDAVGRGLRQHAHGERGGQQEHLRVPAARPGLEHQRRRCRRAGPTRRPRSTCR